MYIHIYIYTYIYILCFWCHFFTILDNPLLLERVTACCPIAASFEPRDAVENLVAQEGQRAWVACSNLPLDLHRVAAIEKSGVPWEGVVLEEKRFDRTRGPHLGFGCCQCRELHW